jgi:hypothetical protein
MNVALAAAELELSPAVSAAPTRLAQLAAEAAADNHYLNPSVKSSRFLAVTFLCYNHFIEPCFGPWL